MPQRTENRNQTALIDGCFDLIVLHVLLNANLGIQMANEQTAFFSMYAHDLKQIKLTLTLALID
jgi:hypothetical protein